MKRKFENGGWKRERKVGQNLIESWKKFELDVAVFVKQFY